MRTPTRSELLEISTSLGLEFNDDAFEDLYQVVTQTVDLMDAILDQPVPQRQLNGYERTVHETGYEPSPDEDPNNAWITKCLISGSNRGALTGKTVALKDNISVRGIRLTNGSRIHEGYVPSTDATLVARVLNEGGIIVGKNTMLAFSAGESAYGIAENPKYPDYSIGGSSSGTAAAVAANEADIGFGGDQGGSIRIPCAFGGLVGLKPTHGLIPYTGIVGVDPTVDHTGPITRNVRDNALALEAVADVDGFDQRQPPDLEPKRYSSYLDADVDSLTIGVLEEAFTLDISDPDVSDKVCREVEKLESLGIEVVDVSLPAHSDAKDIAFPVLRYGVGQLLQHAGHAIWHKGWYDTEQIASLGTALDSRMSDLPPTILNFLLASEYIRRNYHGMPYARAQNLAKELSAKYDGLLEDVDALAMPTTPVTPPEPDSLTGLDALVEHGPRSGLGRNTSIFNVTHHPALALPCGTLEGAPVSLSLVGRHYEEHRLYQIGQAFENMIYT